MIVITLINISQYNLFNYIENKLLKYQEDWNLN